MRAAKRNAHSSEKWWPPPTARSVSPPYVNPMVSLPPAPILARKHLKMSIPGHRTQALRLTIKACRTIPVAMRSRGRTIGRSSLLPGSPAKQLSDPVTDPRAPGGGPISFLHSLDPKPTWIAPQTGHPIGAKPILRQLEHHPAGIRPCGEIEAARKRSFNVSAEATTGYLATRQPEGRSLDLGSR